MIHNPIVQAVAGEAAARDLPISGVTVIAPLTVGAPLLSIGWAHMQDEESGDAGVAGVSVAAMARVPDTMVDLPPMVDTDTMAIAAAWAHGAWDIKRTAVEAGYTGALPPYAEIYADQYRAQGYVSWYWRPMMRGPEIRAKQVRGDVTLDRWTLGRSEPLPALRAHRIVPNRQVVIKLGHDGAKTDWPAPPRPRRKGREEPTRVQIEYLTDLLRRAGEDEALPAGLTRKQASAMISDLIDRVRR